MLPLARAAKGTANARAVTIKRRLVIGENFTQVIGVPTWLVAWMGVARWTGTPWKPLSGFPRTSQVMMLAFDRGEVFARGELMLGGVATRVARCGDSVVPGVLPAQTCACG